MMKTAVPTKANKIVADQRPIQRRSIVWLVAMLGLALLISTSGFQTYWSKERRLIAAADEIVTALRAYRDGSPGTTKDFPLELADLSHDPRMLSDTRYLATLPVDPITQSQKWGVVRNQSNQIIGVHSLSNESPTLFAKLFTFPGGEKYSDWRFLAV
jgi:type II secretory pathway pseudopilin PulG